MNYGLVDYWSRKKKRKNKVLVTIALIVFIFLLTFVLHVKAETLTIHGKVVKVFDGDTIRLMPYSEVPKAKTHQDGTISVRLRGCDAPEKKQPYGIGAKDNLVNLIKGKNVKVEIKDIDKYGRVSGYIYLDNKNINLEQVRSGYAWAYAKYLDRPYASEFYEAEKEARNNKLGLWKENNPMPPWEWRKLQKNSYFRF